MLCDCGVEVDEAVAKAHGDDGALIDPTRGRGVGGAIAKQLDRGPEGIPTGEVMRSAV